MGSRCRAFVWGASYLLGRKDLTLSATRLQHKRTLVNVSRTLMMGLECNSAKGDQVLIFEILLM
jgi:hypothetical protein